MLDAVLGTRMGHGLPHQLVVSVGMDDKPAARDDRTAFEDPAHPRLPYVQPPAGDRPAAPCPAEADRWVPCRPPSRPWHRTVEGSVVVTLHSPASGRVAARADRTASARTRWPPAAPACLQLPPATEGNADGLRLQDAGRCSEAHQGRE